MSQIHVVNWKACEYWHNHIERGFLRVIIIIMHAIIQRLSSIGYTYMYSVHVHSTPQYNSTSANYIHVYYMYSCMLAVLNSVK